MTAPNITQILDRIEGDHTTPSDAEALRQHLSLLSVQQIAERQRFGARLQARVLNAVTRRGYRDGWNDVQFAARQVAKALEELAELGALFDLPHGFVWGFQECLQEAGCFARSIFDQHERWLGVEMDLDDIDTEALARELADVIIPILNLASVFNIDVLEVVDTKARQDVGRGVRNS